MPELPEVESVRRGLAGLVTGRTVTGVEVVHPRLLRDHEGGPGDFAARLRGVELGVPQRRGKYLWVPLAAREEALGVHLGMSGQVRVVPPDAARHPHTRVVLSLDDGCELRFVDQRMFGRLRVDELVTAPAAPGGGEDTVPAHAIHIARDPLHDAFDDADFARRLRARRTVLKRALLDQTLVSGIGNIYADESLWRARAHGERATDQVGRGEALRLIAAVRDVLLAALAAGGTSFDALYVQVNGESGRYGTSLSVYGRAGEPCPRCGTPVTRVAFTNRSSFSCSSCQPAPRRRSPGGRRATIRG